MQTSYHPPPSTFTITATTPPTIPPAPALTVESRRSSPAFSARQPWRSVQRSVSSTRWSHRTWTGMQCGGGVWLDENGDRDDGPDPSDLCNIAAGLPQNSSTGREDQAAGEGGGSESTCTDRETLLSLSTEVQQKAYTVPGPGAGVNGRACVRNPECRKRSGDTAAWRRESEFALVPPLVGWHRPLQRVESGWKPGAGAARTPAGGAGTQ